MSPAGGEIFDLSERVTIITGGGGMLGERHAEAIAEFGGRVVLADINPDKASRVADAVKEKFGGETMAAQVDITDKESVDAMVQSALDRFGRIDSLINNAAMTVEFGGGTSNQYFANFEDYPLDLWEMALKVNLTGAFLCSQSVGKVLVEREGGVIVNISSDVGVISPDHRIYDGETFNTPLHYCVSKTGVTGLTRYLATYWADRGIRVNSLSPAGVYDDHDPRFVEKLASRIPLGRMAHKDEYKGAIVFLLSDASSFMTGSNLVVDGGRTIW